MTSITAIRDGLATRLKTIPKLHVDRSPAGSPILPAAEIELEEIAFDATMGRGSDDFVFLVRLFTSTADDKTGAERLDRYCATSGPSSVKAAIEADQTLGGIVHFAVVSGARDLRLREYAQTECVSIEFVVGVTADGS